MAIYCGHCAADISHRPALCPSCGAEILWRTSAPREGDEGASSAALILVVFVLGVVLLFAVTESLLLIRECTRWYRVLFPC